MKKYRTKPILVEAIQHIDKEKTIEFIKPAEPLFSLNRKLIGFYINNNKFFLRSGDWIVKDSNLFAVYNDEEFKGKFEVAEPEYNSLEKEIIELIKEYKTISPSNLHKILVGRSYDYKNIANKIAELYSNGTIIVMSNLNLKLSDG